jgi:hypothetical protein
MPQSEFHCFHVPIEQGKEKAAEYAKPPEPSRRKLRTAAVGLEEVPLAVAQLPITCTQPATHLEGVTGPIKSLSSKILLEQTKTNSVIADP